LVGLDTALTDELVREGLIREILRTVQDARKQAGLNVSDRIVLNIDGNEPVMAAMSAHREYIVSEALVNGWQPLSSPPAFSIEHRLGARGGEFASRALASSDLLCDCRYVAVGSRL